MFVCTRHSKGVHAGACKLPTGLDLVVLDCIKHFFGSPHCFSRGLRLFRREETLSFHSGEVELREALSIPGVRPADGAGTDAEASTARFWFYAPHGAAQAGLTGEPSGAPGFAMKRMCHGKISFAVTENWG